MAKISLDAAALSAILDAIPEENLTDELKSLRERNREQLAAAKIAEILKSAEAAIGEKVKSYREKHLETLTIPEAVDFIGLDFSYDTEKKRFTPSGMRTLYVGGGASEEMQGLCAALSLVESKGITDAVESSIGAERFNQVVSQSEFDPAIVRNAATSQHSQHWTDGVTIPDNVTMGSVEIVYNSAAYVKAHGVTADQKLAGAGWATLRVKLGKSATRRGTKRQGTGRTKIPGFPSIKAYAESIADDKLQKILDKGKDYNANQHCIRIEKEFSDDADKLYHKAAGLI